MSIAVVILAAGKGTRMGSNKPKVLHNLAGQPLLGHILATVAKLPISQTIVVTGYESAQVEQFLQGTEVKIVEQSSQLGTGHALQIALPALNPEIEVVLVLNGDGPLVALSTLKQAIAMDEQAVNIVTAHLAEPAGYGRIMRDANAQILGIVEDKDLLDKQRPVKEVNGGIYAFKRAHLAKWLPLLSKNNTQQEYYITELIDFALEAKVRVNAILVKDKLEIMGVNSQVQLVYLERELQLQRAYALLEQGVKLYDPSRIDIRGSVTVGRDVTIDNNVILVGEVILEDNVTIGPNVYLADSYIKAGSEIYANSVIEKALVGRDCVIGPFARIRGQTTLGDKAKVGNFVEIKNSTLGVASKACHLSYVGDATIGSKVNIGAGTVTCNYDGIEKHRTTIEDGAFIGSNTELIAPINVGENAIIGAGTTLVKDAPAAKLTLTKKNQTTILDWVRPQNGDV